MTPIKLTVKLEGGLLLTRENMHRIRARALKPCTSVIHSKIPRDGSYFETYVVKHDKAGFRFEEVTHGMGMCGWHKNIRALVINTIIACGSHEIYVEDEKPAGQGGVA